METPVKAATEVAFGNGQDDLPVWRRLMELTHGVLGIPKHPHLLEEETILPQNAASATMVPAGGWQQDLRKSMRDKSKDQAGILTVNVCLG